MDVWVSQTLTTIAVSPASASLVAGETRQFTATANDQFGAAMAAQPTFAWATTAGTMGPGGLLTAPNAAISNGVVTATSGTFSGTIRGAATFTVTPNQPPRVALSATAAPATVTGTSTNLAVLGADDGGEANLRCTWALTKTLPSGLPAPTFSASGTNAAKNATVALSKAGAYTFTVTITDAWGLTTTAACPWQ